MSVAINKRERAALEYYAIDLPPKDPAKLHSHWNKGWTGKTIDALLDRGMLTCGANGWHVLTEKGRAALIYARRETEA